MNYDNLHTTCTRCLRTFRKTHRDSLLTDEHTATNKMAVLAQVQSNQLIR